MNDGGIVDGNMGGNRNAGNINEISACGKVWLAGAGPGDAGLLTVKAAHPIESADVIVYDALISAELLRRIPKDTETIYVGKHSGNHPVPQHEINQILVREAKKGKKVLRLKGGDPFVFGTGRRGAGDTYQRTDSFRGGSRDYFFCGCPGLRRDSGDAQGLYFFLSCHYRTCEERRGR